MSLYCCRWEVRGGRKLLMHFLAAFYGVASSLCVFFLIKTWCLTNQSLLSVCLQGAWRQTDMSQLLGSFNSWGQHICQSKWVPGIPAHRTIPSHFIKCCHSPSKPLCGFVSSKITNSWWHWRVSCQLCWLGASQIKIYIYIYKYKRLSLGTFHVFWDIKLMTNVKL